jgi:hypothetical protein
MTDGITLFPGIQLASSVLFEPFLLINNYWGVKKVRTKQSKQAVVQEKECHAAFLQVEEIFCLKLSLFKIEFGSQFFSFFHTPLFIVTVWNICLAIKKTVYFSINFLWNKRIFVQVAEKEIFKDLTMPITASGGSTIGRTIEENQP